MKYFVTLISLFLSTPILAQRYDNTRTYDIIGLADGDEIMDALAIGIPLIIVGFLIASFIKLKKQPVLSSKPLLVGLYPSIKSSYE